MQPKKVLIIDDETTFSKCIKMNLELSGRFSVETADSGKQGIRLAKTFKPDIILLDITMPQMDGLQVLDELKEDAATISIPVVMLSALSDEETKVRASSKYSQHYITKPVSTDKLIEKLDWALGIDKDDQ